MIVLGIESTSHTSSVGLSQDGVIKYVKSHTYKPDIGGINPRDAADHHRKFFPILLEELFDESGIKFSEIDKIAFSVGPGLGPSLKVGASLARYLAMKYNKPLVPVNHGIGHLEVARVYSNLNDPLYLYVSGGNTQVILHGKGRYTVVGETLDIGVGNFLDKLAREMGIPFPGAPVLEKLAKGGREILDCPYIVKAMDVSFSGLFTFLKNKIGKVRDEDIAFNAQEYAFSALGEVSERAMAHYGLTEITVTGGVAMNRRLREILGTMAEERGWKFSVPPDNYLQDNGGMIALAGEKIQGTFNYQIPINQYDRLDSWDLNFVNRDLKYSIEGVGGESIISKEEMLGLSTIKKTRNVRKYRNEVLDGKIRNMRIRREIRAYAAFKDLRVNSPNIIFVDMNKGIIWIEEINGKKLTNVLLEENYIDLSDLGEEIGRLHHADISHGDLTTSNILYSDGKFFLIDPSMAEFNAGIEEKAVDIHLFKESLKTLKHNWEEYFINFMEGYGKEYEMENIMKRVEEIEKRRRYVL